MSAYLIEPHKALIIAVHAHRASGYTPSLPDKAAAFAGMSQVWATNVQSLRARYPGEGAHGLRHDMVFWQPIQTAKPDTRRHSPTYQFKSADDVTQIGRITDGLILAASEISPAIVWWIAAEANYQCCEFEGYRNTPGGKLIDDAQHQAGRAMASKVEKAEAGWPDIKLVDSGAISLSSLIGSRG